MPLFKLIALVLPLSLDTFAVSAALGVAGLSRSQRLRLSLLMAAFEAGMPLVGFLSGGLLGRAIGSLADNAAAVLLFAVGLLMLREGGSERDEDASDWRTKTRGMAALGVGLSVSLDELAIGFAMGLLRLPAPLLLALIGAQAVVASQLGALLGARAGRALAERAERAAAGLLIMLGLGLFVLNLSGHAVG